MKVTRELAERVLKVVDAGLVTGLGEAIPGRMCVEAAVNYALGLPHGDNPSCVGPAVRAFKIRLNDANWPTDKDRTKGMRKLAIAQLGSDKIDQNAFRVYVAVETVKRILPIAYADAAAAYAAAAYADAAGSAARIKVLSLAAQIGLEALQKLNSPGCKWLDLCE